MKSGPSWKIARATSGLGPAKAWTFFEILLFQRQGLSSSGIMSLLAGSDGSVWMGSSDGLNRWKDGEITVYRKQPANSIQRASHAPGREVVDAGLPGASSTCLLEDRTGRIWVASTRGLA